MELKINVARALLEQYFRYAMNFANNFTAMSLILKREAMRHEANFRAFPPKTDLSSRRVNGKRGQAAWLAYMDLAE